MSPPPLHRRIVAVPLLGGLLAVMCLASLAIGPVSIGVGEMIGHLLSGISSEEIAIDAEYSRASTIVRQLRSPRVLLAVLVGASLALSGAVMQGFFQNPMADPYIVGVSSGAGLGASLAFALALDFWIAGIHSASLFAFVGAVAVAFFVYTVSLRGGRVPATLLLLTGVAVGSLAAAFTSLLMITEQESLHRIVFWLMGSLSSRRWDHVQMIWPFTVGGAVVLQIYARDLNVMLQGEESARFLGVDVERAKILFLVVTALLTAAAVSVSGIIGFVGLIVPHIMRLLVGPDHRRLFPACILGGAILVVGADMIARSLIPPAEVPVGVITAMLGCPFFLYLVRGRRVVALCGVTTHVGPGAARCAACCPGGQLWC
ncbi:MAG: iron chelate uptake ABC transporter family permease subunit [Candidatus Latescibacterota bacterium]|nr:iron chelate uptake ABC transporter family permease subunit [Candidatus Latescibacterota bacterium]